MKKYLSQYKENRTKFLERIQRNNEDIPLNFEILADLSLYRQVEKRGFRACVRGEEIACEELYQFALRKMMSETTLDWYETPVPSLRERRKTMGLI